MNFITDVISDMRRMGIPLPKSGTGRLADSVVVEIPKGQYRRKITLSGTEYRVLMFIQGKEVRPGPTEISQKLSIKRNTVRNALISLKRKGFAIPYSKDGFPTGKRAPTTKEFVIDGKEYQLTAREQRFFNAAMEVGYHVEPIAKQSGLPRERVLEIADKLRRRGIAIPIWGRPRPPWFVVKERLNTTSIRKTAESFGKSTALITRMMKEHQYRTPRSQYKGRPRPAYIRKHR